MIESLEKHLDGLMHKGWTDRQCLEYLICSARWLHQDTARSMVKNVREILVGGKSMGKLRVYISGPMRGYEDYNYPTFNAAAEMWRKAGHMVDNPAEAFDGKTGLAFEEYIRRDLIAICQGDTIAFLPGWEESRGAKIEWNAAKACGCLPYNALTMEPMDPDKVLEEYAARETAEADTSATHLDDGKLRMDLLPVRPLLGTVGILTHGTEKYAPRNWEKGMKWSRLFGSSMRHLFAWWGGEDIDPESGLPHLDHLSCDIMFLQEYAFTHPELDDRQKINLPPKSSLKDAMGTAESLGAWTRGLSANEIGRAADAMAAKSRAELDKTDHPQMSSVDVTPPKLKNG